MAGFIQEAYFCISDSLNTPSKHKKKHWKEVFPGAKDISFLLDVGVYIYVIHLSLQHGTKRWLQLGLDPILTLFVKKQISKIKYLTIKYRAS